MSWFSIVLLVLIIGLTTWLLIDTIIWAIKKVKNKKIDKGQNTDDK